MENTQSHEFPCFLSRENDLESVQGEYFNLRLAEEEVNEEEDFSHDSTDDETGFDIDLEFSELDSFERSRVDAFIRKTCGCTLGDEEKPCSSTFQLDDIIDCRNNCAELESSELNLVILGIIQSAINCDSFSSLGRKETKRQWSRITLSFHGHRICLKTFLFMHRLHKTRFYSLVKHYRKNGLTLEINCRIEKQLGVRMSQSPSYANRANVRMCWNQLDVFCFGIFKRFCPLSGEC